MGYSRVGDVGEIRCSLLLARANLMSKRKVAEKPSRLPDCISFGSGPCRKRPGWSLDALADAPVGRSHRSTIGKAKLKKALVDTKRILRLPDDYLVGIVPASDTGAFEMAMWSMLGARPVDVCHWETFGKGWMTDAVNELKLKDVTKFGADWGDLPDLSNTNPSHDIVFTWNGTTSGVRVPDASWIADDREGLTLCDATSAIFAMELPWSKLDVITYSWQKVLGGEGAHGMLILSPRAVQRLESYVPDRPIPKIFRMAKDGKLLSGIFDGETINTPSMLCNEDYLDALEWAESIGGEAELIRRSNENLGVLKRFVEDREWISFLAKDPATISSTSICLSLALSADKVSEIVKLLAAEKAAVDIGSYKDAPPGLRIWGGATVQKEDLEILMEWLDWAYEKVSA